MKSILRFSVCLCLIICLSIFLPACKKKETIQTIKKAMIGDVNYTSLTDAVKNAKSGDTILVYDDIKDNKNVLIDKPLTIKGVLDNGGLKPKFYGSLTIDTSGEKDEVNIENLEIIHDGTLQDGLNNDTRIGVNLINGGLTFESNSIRLNDIKTADGGASGLVVSRKINSLSTMPIIIKGNTFNAYKIDDAISSALLIKSNKPKTFKKIALNEGEIYNQNSFDLSKEGNLMISADYSNNDASYSFFATGSADELIKALEKNQDKNGSTFILYPHSALSSTSDTPYIIEEKTYLYIEGNTPADFNKASFNLAGSMVVGSGLKNASIERTTDTANLTIKDYTKLTNVMTI